MIIGVDHGYSAMKTAHICFPSGIVRYEHEPYTNRGVLRIEGKYYVCGTGRQPLLRTKTENEQYYLLTLAAIAQEMDKFRQLWYEERRMGGRSHSHYDDTRYYALNLHAVFDKGTVEWRCFNSTLHAGKVRANITLALAISAQAINQKCTHMRKTEISENPCFTFRTFLLRLGLIGPEYKNVRKHLLDHLEGDKAWRYDKNTYECLKRKQEER